MKTWLDKVGLVFNDGQWILLLALAASCLNLSGQVENKLSNRQVALGEMSLTEALRHVAAEAAVDLVYADSLVEEMWVVHLPEGQATIDQRMKFLLNGTDLDFKLNQNGRLVLFRDPSLRGRRISGYVISARGGGAIVGAQVKIPGTGRYTRTDVTGAFSLESVPEKFNRIEVVAKGLALRNLDLGALGETELLVIMNQVPELSESLRVYAPKRTRLTISPLTGRYSLTSDPQFQEGPPGWDLFDSLKDLPGVNAGNGEPGLEFRGGQPSENLVLLDGIQLFQFDHALGSFSALNADAIGEIEVFKGGYPANYGDRLTGVLALTTREDVFQESELRFGIDRDKADLTFLTPLGSKFAVLVSARSSLGEDISNSAYDRSFQSTFNRQGVLGENAVGIRNSRDISFSDFIGKIAWRPTLSDTVNFTIYSGKDEVREGLIQQFVFDDTFKKDGELTNEGASFQWTRLWSSNFQTRALVTNSQYSSFFLTQELDWEQWLARYREQETLPPAPYAYLQSQIANRLEDSSSQLEVEWQVDDMNTLKIGVSGSNKEVSQAEITWYDTPRLFFQETRQRTAFIQDEWRPNRWFTSLMGVRYTSNSLTETTVTEPRFSFQVNPNKAWSLRGSYGKYHQHLLRTPDNLNYFYGIETWFLAFDLLQPGEAKHGQLGVAFDKNDWSVDLEYFQRDQEGALFRAFEPIGRDFTVHQSREEIRGIDMLVRHKRGQFSSSLGYSYHKANVVEDLTFGIPLFHPTDRNRPHQVHVGLNYSRGPWRTVLAWRFASGLPYSVPEIGLFIDEEGMVRPRLLPSFEPNDRRLPSTHQLDARFQYSFVWNRWHGNLGLYLFNIYDRTNSLYRYYTLEDEELLPVDVPGFGFRPSIRLQLVY